MVELVGEERVEISPDQCTTDANDVSNIIPVLHASIGGVKGRAHSLDYEVSDPELAYIKAAKMLAMTVVDLLSDGAQRGIEVKETYNAPLTKESYISLLNSAK